MLQKIKVKISSSKEAFFRIKFQYKNLSITLIFLAVNIRRSERYKSYCFRRLVSIGKN